MWRAGRRRSAGRASGTAGSTDGRPFPWELKCRAVERGGMSPEYERILVPTDGSDGVERALDHALRLADDHDATVHALSVVDRRLTRAAGGSGGDLPERLRERSEEAVAAVADRVEAAGLDAVTAVREGVPDKEIVDYAAEEDVDVVVIGTYGRTGRERLVHLGSVTERVVKAADRPVFVVHVEE